MKIIDSKVTREELIEKYLNYFRRLIKGVVDTERGIIALDAELHSDLELRLLKSGSKQENLWGINLYPHKDKEDFIEYTALINIKPQQNNYSMEIESIEVKERIKEIAEKLITL